MHIIFQKLDTRKLDHHDNLCTHSMDLSARPSTRLMDNPHFAEPEVKEKQKLAGLPILNHTR